MASPKNTEFWTPLFPCNGQVNLSLPRAPSHQKKVTVF